MLLSGTVSAKYLFLSTACFNIRPTDPLPSDLHNPDVHAHTKICQNVTFRQIAGTRISSCIELY